MGDREHARALLRMADKDLRALVGMGTRPEFDDEIFGFHAQQAVEKSLKAWLAAAGEEYPRTHDLAFLLDVAADAGFPAGPHRNLRELTVFGVQLRYEAIDLPDEPLDRSAVLDAVRGLYLSVEGSLG